MILSFLEMSHVDWSDAPQPGSRHSSRGRNIYPTAKQTYGYSQTYQRERYYPQHRVQTFQHQYEPTIYEQPLPQQAPAQILPVRETPKIFVRADGCDAFLDLRVILPSDKYPKINWGGRIIGHKGSTIRELQTKNCGAKNF